MKTVRTFITALAIALGSVVASAQPMSYYAMRDNARFLTDRMAYTLGITAGAVIDDLYRINYDYICGVNDYLDDVAMGYRYDDYMAVMYERDRALRLLLGDYTWRRLMSYDYFYRPIAFSGHRWSFSIYAHDTYRGRFYFDAPRYYTGYRGGHFFAGMRPGPGMDGMRRDDVRPMGGSRPGFHIGNTNDRGSAPGGGIRDNGRNDRGAGDMRQDDGGRQNNAERDNGRIDRGTVSDTPSRTDVNRRSSSRSTYTPSRSVGTSSRDSYTPSRSSSMSTPSRTSTTRSSAVGSGSAGSRSGAGNMGGGSRGGGVSRSGRR